AALGAEHVTVEQLEAAEAARDAAHARLAEAAGTLAATTERLEARRSAAGGTLAEVEERLALARAGVSDALAAVGRVRDVEASLAAFDRETHEVAAQVAQRDVALTESRAAHEAANDALTLAEVEVEAARDGAESVRVRLALVDERIGHLTAWGDALARVEEATATHDARLAELATALVEHDFADGAAVRAAALDAVALRDLERAVTEHDRALSRVRSGLAEPELVALPAVVDVDLDALASAHETADALATEAAHAEARSAHLAEAASSAHDQLARALAAQEAAHADAGPVVRMANVAAASGGDNAKQLSLATYVLMRRFEDVVAAANSRLVTMSDGRYELVRSDEREAVRSRRTGLAMKVVDHRTGVERDARTLSGGETFYVSLCLALGLADVVTAEAGGTDLGTLFIDEGFGTLDPETLEVVLAELGRLRDGGRVVGVVSHVEALKQSIAERIEVRCHPDGSSTLTVRA
ncbi:SbcC/MukB-like Walker B domain-containing protein, partial [Actinotalea sp. JY-7885]|uniref:SbcC/MukB-like Walker B domain-containing protein n=1 Tax=Actinotalea sp. JY-7885 TaxID=2758576 RepID=UPI002714FDC6